MNTPQPIDVWSLDTRSLGTRVHVFDRVMSTNTLALDAATDAMNHGLVILAHEQTAGRGQYGRSWHAPASSSILMSVLLFPPSSLRRPVLLTAWAAVSVCETIAQLTDLQARIKWPNDILIQGKKICGILIEQRTTGLPNSPVAAVAGIGLNISQSETDFVDANLPNATSLAACCGIQHAFEQVAKTLIYQLDRHYLMLLSGEESMLESSWKGRIGLVGRRVVAKDMKEKHAGRLLDVSFSQMVLQCGNGHILSVQPEAIVNVMLDTPPD